MINDLKDLQSLLKLCRKQGVSEITLAGTVIKFGELPRKSAGDEDDDPKSVDPSFDALSPEQQMFFSVGGVQPP